MNTLELSTSNAATDQNNRLRYKLKTPLTIDGYVAMSNITLWYNWKNITTANNSLSYKKNDSTFEITLPSGSYSVKDINNYIHMKMEANNHIDASKSVGSDKRYGINLYANTTYNRVSLVLSAGYEVQFGKGLAKTLGALTTSYRGSSSTNFPNIPHIENVKSVQIHCNLVYNE